jgi:hypothetical protein
MSWLAAADHERGAAGSDVAEGATESTTPELNTTKGLECAHILHDTKLAIAAEWLCDRLIGQLPAYVMLLATCDDLVH